eukprot:scaffold12806_cov55-Attheya_sp.AAC.8
MLWWILESQVVVVKEHRGGLIKCGQAGSITGWLVSWWGAIMCFPQWVFGLMFGLLGHPEGALIFGARMAAMCIVRKLDEKIPLTRALGLCHLLTFGPVFAWLLLFRSQASAEEEGTTSCFAWFMWFEMRVIPLCLFLDARDLLLQLAGYPFPCYIREGVQYGVMKHNDPRAKREVTWLSRLVGP